MELTVNEPPTEHSTAETPTAANTDTSGTRASEPAPPPSSQDMEDVQTRLENVALQDATDADNHSTETPKQSDKKKKKFEDPETAKQTLSSS